MSTDDDDPIADLLARYHAQQADPSLIPTRVPEPVATIEPVGSVESVGRDRILPRIRSGFALVIVSAVLGAAVAALVVTVIVLAVLALRALLG